MYTVAQHSFLQHLKLKMTTTFTDYADQLLAQKDAFTAIFGPEGTGMMAIENIITMVLINGLPDEFKYMKDLIFSKDLMGAFHDFGNGFWHITQVEVEFNGVTAARAVGPAGVEGVAAS